MKLDAYKIYTMVRNFRRAVSEAVDWEGDGMNDFKGVREYERRACTLPMVIESADGERSYGIFMNFSEKGGLYKGKTLFIPHDGYFFFTVAAGSFGCLTGQARAVTDLKNQIGFVYDEMNEITYRNLRNLILAQSVPNIHGLRKVG